MRKLWTAVALGIAALAAYYCIAVDVGPASVFVRACCGVTIGLIALMAWAVVNPDA